MVTLLILLSLSFAENVTVDGGNEPVLGERTGGGKPGAGPGARFANHSVANDGSVSAYSGHGTDR